MYRLKGITEFHYLSLELESEASLHKPSLYCHRARAFQILTCRPVVLRSPNVPSSHSVTRTFRKPYRNCISFGFISNILHAQMLNAHPKIFCFRVLGLFSSFGFGSNIPRTHHAFLFPSFGFVLEFWVGFRTCYTHTNMLNAHPTFFYFRVFGLFGTFHTYTHHDALRPPHDFLILSFGFVSNISHTHTMMLYAHSTTFCFRVLGFNLLDFNCSTFSYV